MTVAPERCSFELNPEAWEREHDGECLVNPDEEILTENSDDKTVWRCPHEAADGGPECAFHLPLDSTAKPDSETVTDAFLEIANGEREALDGDGSRPARFLGAVFESLNLDTEQIGDGRPIDLRHAKVDCARWKVGTVEADPLDARGAYIRGAWDCDGVTFGGDAWFRDAEFGGAAEFEKAEFGGTTDFKKAEFGGAAEFEKAEFGGDARFIGAEFSGDARFTGAEFGRDTRFIGAKFDDFAWFNMVEFDRDTWFREAQFEKAATFTEAEFGRKAWFTEAEFGGVARFIGVEFGRKAAFKETEFGGIARFREADFKEGAKFTVGGGSPTSQFQNSAEFSDVTADGPLRFVDEYDSPPEGGYTFLGEVDFEGADIPDLEFSDISFREAPTFAGADLTRADLSGVLLKRATFEGANLTRADLSESDLSGAVFNDAVLSQTSLYGTDLTNARLYGARMDGAHVSDHTDFGVRDQVSASNQDDKKRSSALPFRGPWPGVRYDERNPEYEQFENYREVSKGEDTESGEAISDHTRAAAVYAEIEQVAEANADSELASRCYLWRKDMQRKRHWSDEGRGNNREPVRWLRSMVANVFVRYGESPWRVTGMAGLVIVSCALLYYFFDLIEYSTSPSQSGLLSTVGGSVPSPVVTALDAVYFSTLTFSTLGMGTFQPSGPWGRAVAIFETLSGVVLLALLVFVFGRRATR